MHDLVLGVQALRRRLERLQLGLGGALGVCASLFPHQLQTVQRVLTAPRVRHLLADEVGLGKTVQTLMLINALRLSEPGLRVLLLVPNELMAQWRDECLARAHEAPTEGELDPEVQEPERSVRLAWPKVLRTEEVDPKLYGLLVVDELHTLPKELQRLVEGRARDFRHVLLLTATPTLQDPEARERLLSVLEPERVALARLRGEDPVTRLGARDAVALAQLSSAEPQWEGLGGAPPAEAATLATALAHGLARGVVRARRADYPDLLPTRQRQALVVEPTAAEVERQHLMWGYLPHLPRMSREFDVERLAQRVIRSPQSLRQRVTYLLGHGHEHEGVLAQVAPLLGPEHGDSRFEALVDLLAELWSERPQEQVLVVAQDNLTVDHLAKTLPLYLPRVGPGQGQPLRCVRVRNQPEAADNLADEGEVGENLFDFQLGLSQLLLAADVAQVGLNLQCARVLVFYSVPWAPQEVEQWIGRLDRIGNRAVYSREGGLLPIELYTIVQRGLVDERVVRVLDAFAVFRRGIRLDGTAILQVTERLRTAALAPEQVDWARLEEEAATLARDEESAQLSSGLSALLPYTAERARRLKEAVESLPPVEPILVEHPGLSAEQQREEALLDWLRLLDRLNEYELRKGRDVEKAGLRFHSLGYTYGVLARSPVQSKVLLLESLGDPNRDRNRTPHAAFRARRREVEQPPSREVRLQPDEPLSPLGFLDHGSLLHEELVSGWMGLVERRHEVGTWRLTLPRGHPARPLAAVEALLLQVSWADPGLHVLPELDHARLAYQRKHTIPSELPEVQVLERQLRGAHAADARWLQSLLPAQLVLSAVRLVEGQWRPADHPELWPWLLRLPVSREESTPRYEAVPPRELASRVAAAEQAASTLARRLLAERWAPARTSLPSAVAVRRYVCQVEGEDLQRLRAREAGDESGSPLRSWDLDVLSPQALAFHATTARQEWLAAIPERAGQAEPQRFASVLLFIQKE